MDNDMWYPAIEDHIDEPGIVATTDVERLHRIECAARRLLFEIDKVPYRLTAQTFGPEAAEVSAALEELRAALNGKNEERDL